MNKTEKKLENLKLDLAHHEQFAADWHWLAQRGGEKRLARLASAKHHEKLARELREEIALAESCAFFSELAEDCPTSNTGCSHSQSSFSKATWR